jgi:hypothetical protein
MSGQGASPPALMSRRDTLRGNPDRPRAISRFPPSSTLSKNVANAEMRQRIPSKRSQPHDAILPFRAFASLRAQTKFPHAQLEPRERGGTRSITPRSTSACTKSST